MTEHRYPCAAEPPPLLTDPGPIAVALTGAHIHACKHDATPEPAHDTGRLIEHACTCGMTWTVAEWQPKPPPDLTWLTELEERQREHFEQLWHQRLWRRWLEIWGLG